MDTSCVVRKLMKLMKVVVLVVCLNGLPICAQGTPCADGWLFYTHSCYLVVQMNATYHQANHSCVHDNGAHLVDISDDDENDYVMSILPGQSDAWIGLWRRSTPDPECGVDCRTEQRQDWEWPDGRNVTYEKWDEDEPNGESQCGRMLKTGMWRDIECDQRYAYICELKLHMTTDLPDTSEGQTTLLSTAAPDMTSQGLSSDEEDDNTIVKYIGAAVAGAGFVLAVVVAVVIAIQCRRRRRRTKEALGSDLTDGYSVHYDKAGPMLDRTPSAAGDSGLYSSIDDAVKGASRPVSTVTGRDYEELDSVIAGQDIRAFPDHSDVIDPYASTRATWPGPEHGQPDIIPTLGITHACGDPDVHATGTSDNVETRAVYALPDKHTRISSGPEVTLLENKVYEHL